MNKSQKIINGYEKAVKSIREAQEEIKKTNDTTVRDLKNKLSRFVMIANSVTKKCFGHYMATNSEEMKAVFKGTDLEWILNYNFIDFSTSEISYDGVLKAKYRHGSSWGKGNAYTGTAVIDLKLISISDRDFAKFVRALIKKYKLSQKYTKASSAAKELAAKKRELAKLEKEIKKLEEGNNKEHLDSIQSELNENASKIIQLKKLYK